MFAGRWLRVLAGVPGLLFWVLTGPLSGQAGEDWTIYRDASCALELTVPPGWSARQHVDGVVRADLLSPDGRSGLQVRLLPPSALTPEAYEAGYVASFQREMGNPPVLERQAWCVGVFKGFNISFDGRARNGYFLKSFVLLESDRVLVLQAGVPWSERGALEPVLDGIAASYRRLLR